MTPKMSKGHTPGQRAAPKKNTPTPNYANESGEGEATSESANTSNAFVLPPVDTLDPNIGINVIALGDQGVIALHFRDRKSGTQVFSKGLTPQAAKSLATYLAGAMRFVQGRAGNGGQR